jgi:hypothetical protein
MTIRNSFSNYTMTTTISLDVLSNKATSKRLSIHLNSTTTVDIPMMKVMMTIRSRTEKTKETKRKRKRKRIS